MRTSKRYSNSSGSVWPGAGLSTTFTLNLLAIFAAVMIVSRGDSSWSKRPPAYRNGCFDTWRYSGLSLQLALEVTTILFWSPSSRVIRGSPLAVPSSTPMVFVIWILAFYLFWILNNGIEISLQSYEFASTRIHISNKIGWNKWITHINASPYLHIFFFNYLTSNWPIGQWIQPNTIHQHLTILLGYV